jgi:excisionase family DNA binding protein
MRVEIDTDAITQRDVPAALVQVAAALSALAARWPGGVVLMQPECVPEPPDQTSLLTVPEVAKKLKLAKSYVYELVRCGRLPALRFGKYRRITPSALERFIAQHEGGIAFDNELSTVHTSFNGTKRHKTPPAASRTEPGRACPTPGRASADPLEVGARRRADAKSRTRAAQTVGAANSPTRGQLTDDV